MQLTRSIELFCLPDRIKNLQQEKFSLQEKETSQKQELSVSQQKVVSLEKVREMWTLPHPHKRKRPSATSVLRNYYKH